MATIRALNVLFKADTRQFRKGTKKAASSLQRFQAVAKGAAVGAFKFTAAISAASIAALSLLVKGQLDAVDAMAKLSDKTGVAVKDLQGLELAAQLAGASTESVAKGLLKLQRSIGDANIGLKAQQDAFKSLGLSAENLTKVPLIDVFKRTADAIKNTEDRTKAAAAGALIFGRGFQDLLVLFRGGARGIEEATRKIEEFGGAITRVEASQIEQANDALTVLGTQLKLVGAQIAIKVAPFIQLAAERFQDLAKSGGGAAEIIGKGFAFVQNILGRIGTVFDVLTLGFNTFSAIVNKGLSFILKGFLQLVKGVDTVLQGLNDIREFVGSSVKGGFVTENLNAIRSAVSETEKFIEGLAESASEDADMMFRRAAKGVDDLAKGEAITKVEKFFNSINEGARKATEGILANSQALKENRDRQSALADFTKRFEELGKIAERIKKKVATPLEVFKKKAMEVVDVFKAGLINEEQFKAAIQKAQEAFNKVSAKALPRTATFREIDVSRTALGGAGQTKVQPVKDPQIPEMIDVLKQINTKIGMPQGAVAT